jgi:hypothetical protein
MNVVVTDGEGLFEMTLKAAVIYDGFDFAARATALLERVAMRAAEAVKWDVRPWRLDMLKHSSLALVAGAETADADLILVAFGQTRSLPAELVDWLERWARNRRIEDAAIMVLLPDENDVLPPLGDELKGFAAWHNLPFLGSRNLRDDGDSLDFVRRLWQRKQPVKPALPWPADRLPVPQRWGINE